MFIVKVKENTDTDKKASFKKGITAFPSIIMSTFEIGEEHENIKKRCLRMV